MFRQKRSKQWTAVLMVLLVIALVFTGCGQSTPEPAPSPEPTNGETEAPAEPEAPAETYRLSYGAGTVGSAVNTVVMGHVALLNEYVPGLEVTAEASGGGVDNLRFTEDDVFQISTAANISMWQAMNGVGDFEGEPVQNVTGWMPMYSSFVQIVVRGDSDIYSVEDLRGKRVSVGLLGSGAEVIASSFFNGADLPYSEFEPYYLAHQETNDAMADGTLDAAFYATGVPTPAVMELGATRDIRLIPVPVEEAEYITADYPFFSPGVIPAETYDFIDEDVPTVQGFTNSFVRRDLPEELVYEMTKAVWEHLDELAQVHSSQRYKEPSMIASGLEPVAEIHPGAARYYREMGWID